MLAARTVAERKAEDADTPALVARVQAGDEQAFTDLYKRFFNRVIQLLNGMIYDSYAAEDVAQEVFAKLFDSKLARYVPRDDTPFRAWLYAVVCNEARSYMRKVAKTEQLVEPAQIVALCDAQHADEGEMPSVGSLKPAWMENEALSILLKRLPNPQRVALTLHHQHDFTQQQIADVLGCSTRAVGQLEYRGRTFLKEQIEAILERRQRKAGSTTGKGTRNHTPMLIHMRPMPVLVARYSALGRSFGPQTWR